MRRIQRTWACWSRSILTGLHGIAEYEKYREDLGQRIISRGNMHNSIRSFVQATLLPPFFLNRKLAAVYAAVDDQKLLMTLAKTPREESSILWHGHKNGKKITEWNRKGAEQLDTG